MNTDSGDPFAPTSIPPGPFAAPGDPVIGAPLSPTGQPGGPTPREMAAVKKLTRALLECVLAFNEGHLLRAGEKGPADGRS